MTRKPDDEKKRQRRLDRVLLVVSEAGEMAAEMEVPRLLSEDAAREAAATLAAGIDRFEQLERRLPGSSTRPAARRAVTNNKPPKFSDPDWAKKVVDILRPEIEERNRKAEFFLRFARSVPPDLRAVHKAVLEGNAEPLADLILTLEGPRQTLEFAADAVRLLGNVGQTSLPLDKVTAAVDDNKMIISMLKEMYPREPARTKWREKAWEAAAVLHGVEYAEVAAAGLRSRSQRRKRHVVSGDD